MCVCVHTPGKLVQVEYTSAKCQVFQKQNKEGKSLNLEHLTCNYKYLKRVFGKYSKDMYVFGP